MKKIILSILILNYSLRASQLDKLYNEQAILMTHNSTSLKDCGPSSITPGSILELLKSFKSGNFVADQCKTVADQLNDGVRGFKIPLHLFSNGEIYICHTLSREQLENEIEAKAGSFNFVVRRLAAPILKDPCILDRTYQRFGRFLQELNTFLYKNPNEVVTIYLDAFALDKANQNIKDKISQAFIESGINNKIYFNADHNNGRAWPTLGKMISDNKRVVIFSGHPHWENLGVFDYSKIVFRTDYDYKSQSELDRDSNNPKIPDGTVAENKLFMIDNYTTPLIAGSQSDAKIVNSYDRLKKRFCQYQNFAGGIKPNILMVDFYHLPDNNDGTIDAIRFINDWNDGKIQC
jgi:hypothetical protein